MGVRLRGRLPHKRVQESCHSSRRTDDSDGEMAEEARHETGWRARWRHKSLCLGRTRLRKPYWTTAYEATDVGRPHLRLESLQSRDGAPVGRAKRPTSLAPEAGRQSRRWQRTSLSRGERLFDGPDGDVSPHSGKAGHRWKGEQASRRRGSNGAE
ncbi:hypothetical protein CDD83_3154 [Cordyceps sp. RAO-2017]|nr:hypothetical protein CDD83_3154 [Cordyceps sp. RAO-2017]